MREGKGPVGVSLRGKGGSAKTVAMWSRGLASAGSSPLKGKGGKRAVRRARPGEGTTKSARFEARRARAIVLGALEKC